MATIRKKQSIGHFRRCCEYIKCKQGILTECGKRANYRKTWEYCPYCGLPISVLFNDDAMKE